MKTERISRAELDARIKRDREFAVTARAFARVTRQQKRRTRVAEHFATVSSKWDLPRRERRAIARQRFKNERAAVAE